MKKVLKNSVLLILTLVLCFSSCVSSFAAEKKVYSYYTALGDSVAGGFGLAEREEASDPLSSMMADPSVHFIENNMATYSSLQFPYGTYVEDAYPALVASSLGLCESKEDYGTKWTNIAACGTTCENILQACTNQEIESYMLELFIENGVEADKPELYGELVRSELAKADLVSIGIGSNDVAIATLDYLPHDNYYNRITWAIEYACMYLLFGFEPVEALLYGLVSSEILEIQDMENISLDTVKLHTEYLSVQDLIDTLEWVSAENLSELMDSYAEYYGEIYGNMISAVVNYKKNLPENNQMDLILVGAYNPYGSSVFRQDETAARLSALVASLFTFLEEGLADESKAIDLLSEVYKTGKMVNDPDFTGSTAQKEKANLLAETEYVVFYALLGAPAAKSIKTLNSAIKETAAANDGICGRVVYVDVSDIPNEANTDPHPEEDGHRFIADRILNAVEALNETYTATTLASYGGTVTTDVSEGSYGEQVTATANPKAGLKAALIRVLSEDGTLLAAGAGDTLKFALEDQNVTVKAYYTTETVYNAYEQLSALGKAIQASREEKKQVVAEKTYEAISKGAAQITETVKYLAKSAETAKTNLGLLHDTVERFFSK